MRPVSQEQISTKRQGLPVALSMWCRAKKPLPAMFKQALMPICCFLIILLFSIQAFAQNVKLTGTVKDGNDMPLPGVSVTVKGTTTGTMTDVNGHFTLNASPGQVVTFTMVGYNPYQLTVGTQTTLDVKLAQATSSLEEVVVVG